MLYNTFQSPFPVFWAERPDMEKVLIKTQYGTHAARGLGRGDRMLWIAFPAGSYR
jgi:hypothetical protein